MSGTNGTAAARKPATSEGAGPSAEQQLRRYADLMREADSPNGGWNPEPEEHTTGMLRHDVELSANESKFLALVKDCSVGNKNARSAWAFTRTGKPLRLTEVAAFFGWDKGNAMKYSKRPLAYGFIRKSGDGQFGIGARVQGKYVEEPEELNQKDELVVCTDNLPNYLIAEIKRLSQSDRKKFLLGWQQIKDASRDRLAAEKKRLYEIEQAQLTSHCKAFDLELKRKNEGKAAKEDSKLSVQTTNVQNEAETLYNASGASVPTTHIRNQSKAVLEEHPSSSWFSTLRKALSPHGVIDDDAIKQLWQSCREKAGDVRPEEIAHFIAVKATLINNNTRNPIGFLLHAVPKCISPQAIEEYRAAMTTQNDTTAWISNEQEYTRAQLEAWLAEENAESVRAAIRARLDGLVEES